MVKRSSLNILIFVCFTLLGIVMMYPMFLDPTRLVVEHDGTRDCFIFFWNFWWTKETLFHLHTSPFSTSYLFYPEGTSLVFHALAFIHNLFSLPFLALLGDLRGAALAYNVFIILSYGLSGLGMYLLVRYLGGNKAGAFVSGLIFAFSPFHFWNLERLNILCIEVLPFYVYFFLKTIHGERKKDALFCGLVLSLTFYSSLTYFLYVMIFSIMYCVYLLFERSRKICPDLLKRAAIAAAVFCLLSFPYAYALGSEYFRNPHLTLPLIQSLGMSAYPPRVLLPNNCSPFYQKVLGLEPPAASPWSVFTGGSFLGLVAIAMSVYAAVGPTRRAAAFWSVSALVFLVLSFGPYLAFSGRPGLLPMPYLFLRRWFPVLAISRTPSRYIAMVMMSASILSGLAVSRLGSKGSSGRLRTILVPGLVGVLVLAENWVPPVLFSYSSVPGIYYEIAQDTSDYIVVDAPFTLELERKAMYYQMVHGKRLLYGAVPRPTHKSSYAMSSPLLRLVQLSSGFRPVFPHQRSLFEGSLRKNIVQADRKMLREWRVKYVILHKKYLVNLDGKFVEDLLKEYRPVSVRQDAANDIVIYRLY